MLSAEALYAYVAAGCHAACWLGRISRRFNRDAATAEDVTADEPMTDIIMMPIRDAVAAFSTPTDARLKY